MNGEKAPAIDEAGVKLAFTNPIGCQPIRELAKGKREIAIVFDDLSRPTRLAPIIPYLLDELWTAGVSRSSVRFICGNGAHAALNAEAFRKKLGSEIVAEFPVYNHNPYENCTYIGTTSKGTRVIVNTEFARCDLRIGLGCIVPHGTAGFGGGSKIILPGVCHIDTIEAMHKLAQRVKIEKPGSISMGAYEGNESRLDIEEAARLAGLHVKIDVLINLKRDTTNLFVGEPTAEYSEGVKVAKEHYATEPVEEADLIIANNYSKLNESIISLTSIRHLIPEKGAVMVVLSFNPEGEVVHYLMRRFGKFAGGRLAPPSIYPAGVSKIIMITPYPDRASLDWFGDKSVVRVKGWEEALKILVNDFPDHARVAVVPDATIQYFRRKT
jgi:nickel-dependent lactate racemase